MPHDPNRPAREWPIPWMDKGSGHKDTAFTWAMGRLILQRIAEGDTMKAITADPRMPAYCTVFRWMQVVPEFGEAVRELRWWMAQERLAYREAVREAQGPKRRSGRRSTYTDKAARAVIRAIEEDRGSVSEIVRRPGMPSFKALYAWLRDRPAFREAFVEALRRRDVGFACQRDEAIDDVWVTGIAAANARLRVIEGRRGRLTPKLYRPRPRPGAL